MKQGSVKGTQMTNLHAHVNTASSDCDGPFYRSYSVLLNEDELAESQKDVNDFHDIHFKERVLVSVISIFAEQGTLKVRPTGLDWSQATDEGYRSADVTWCEEERCNVDEYSQRDVFAEQMGY